jgi:hypothetical protein
MQNKQNTDMIQGQIAQSIPTLTLLFVYKIFIDFTSTFSIKPVGCQ